MKIVLLDYSTLGNIEGLEVLSSLGDFSYYEFTSKEDTIDRIGDAEIVITNKVVIDRKVIDACQNIRLISILATGTDNVDLAHAESKGIAVKNVVGYSTKSVTQQTFASLFYLLHQMKFYDDYVKSGEYAKSKIFTHIGYEYWELKDKEFGIIGFGNIGKNVAKVAQAFGANVSYYSTSGLNTNTDFEQKILEDLLKDSDVVSIHAPLNERTKNLIKAECFDLMKTSSILINMGRGGIVNEADLALALDQNKIFGAALDVLKKEPITGNNPLLNVTEPERLIITPHIAWASKESRQTLIKETINNVKSIL